MGSKYIKKKEPLSVQEKLDLLSRHAWDIDEIQSYWNLRRETARDIRNFIKNTKGLAKYTKTKVLVSDVMKKMDTTIEEQVKLLKNFIFEVNGIANPRIVEKDGSLYVQVHKTM